MTQMADFLSNPIVAMVLMLGGLVLFHELGHFIVGRLCGVAVETFSIGFGATIFAKKIKSTTFQISWLPLGGFVKFYGASRNEDVPDDLDGAVYHSAPIWKRGLIIAAGPAANFLLAFVIFWIMVMVGMEVPPPTVGDVIEKSRAQAAGIMPGDRFLEVDGESVKAWSDIERKISRSPEMPLKVKVLRSGREQELTLVPEKVEGVSLFGSKAKIGRAGIALGYPSAVVTVLDDKSVLGQSGLRTTDRIDSYVDSSGQTVKINGFHDLLALFQVWKKSGLQKIDWNVQTVKVTLDKDGRPKEATEGTLRKISVDLSTWPDVGGLSDRAYANKLGVSDSHLTLAVPQGKTAETLKMGDHLLEWNGQPVKTIYHLQELMMDNKTPTADVKVSRQGVVETLTVALKSTDLQKPEGMVTIFVLDAVMLGMSGMPSPSLIQYKNPIKAAGVAIAEGYSPKT